MDFDFEDEGFERAVKPVQTRNNFENTETYQYSKQQLLDDRNVDKVEQAKEFLRKIAEIDDFYRSDAGQLLVNRFKLMEENKINELLLAKPEDLLKFQAELKAIKEITAIALNFSSERRFFEDMIEDEDLLS